MFIYMRLPQPLVYKYPGYTSTVKFEDEGGNPMEIKGYNCFADTKE